MATHKWLTVIMLAFVVILLPSVSNARWISVDPKASQYPSVSPYTYALNNPLKFNDPTGQWPERIHNEILDKAFTGMLTKYQISILKEASAFVDKDQSTSGSFMHAMRSSGQSVEDAEKAMNDFVNNKTQDFVNCPGNEGLFALGEAFHALMDQSSPSHSGFQEWKGVNIGNAVDGLVHVLKERKISQELLDQIVKILQASYQKAVEQQKEAQRDREAEDNPYDASNGNAPY